MLSRQLKRLLLLSLLADIDSIGTRLKQLLHALSLVPARPGRPQRLAAGQGQRGRHPLSAADDQKSRSESARGSVSLETQAKYPNNLTIELDALVTRVIFDDQNRAVGVEYRKGARLYQAHAESERARGEPREVRVTQEVILAGGAFNTPQLLMLSGDRPEAGAR